MMRESSIERYLVRQVKAAGGECRKFVTPGRRHAPDRLVLIPAKGAWVAQIVFVETKAPGKKARPGQKREHKRLRGMGFTVRVINTKGEVAAFIENWFEVA